jgi:rhodanese-related sulfurtransferase
MGSSRFHFSATDATRTDQGGTAVASGDVSRRHEKFDWRRRRITPRALLALPSERRPVLIDVREAGEWRSGSIEGALHISSGLIEVRIASAVSGLRVPLLCYCTDGRLSLRATEILQRLGYRNARSLKGGLLAWAAAGGPVKSYTPWD